MFGLETIWLIIMGIGGVVATWLGFKIKRANTKAAEATARAERAEEVERQVQGAADAQDKAQQAAEAVRKKPLKSPSKKRSDFEKPS